MVFVARKETIMIPIENMQKINKQINIQLPSEKKSVSFQLYRYNYSVVNISDASSNADLFKAIYARTLINPFRKPDLIFEEDIQLRNLPGKDIPCYLSPSLGYVALLRAKSKLPDECPRIILTIEDASGVQSSICLIGFLIRYVVGDKLQMTYIVDSQGRQTLGSILCPRLKSNIITIHPIDFLEEGYWITKKRLVGMGTRAFWHSLASATSSNFIGSLIVAPFAAVFTVILILIKLPFVVAANSRNQKIDEYALQLQSSLEAWGN
jgi:hypothetical protein